MLLVNAVMLYSPCICSAAVKCGHGPKNFGASIEIFEPVYNTMLHQISSDTHTHTHSECKHFSLTKISLQNRQKLKLLNKDLMYGTVFQTPTFILYIHLLFTYTFHHRCTSHTPSHSTHPHMSHTHTVTLQ